MSLQVYFGDTLIDEQHYTGLNNNFELFNESFKLGSTPSNKYTLRIAKEGVTEQPTSITLKDNDTTFAELDIDNIEINPYTTIRDVGKASLSYINNKSRQLGESVVV